MAWQGSGWAAPGPPGRAAQPPCAGPATATLPAAWLPVADGGWRVLRADAVGAGLWACCFLSLRITKCRGGQAQQGTEVATSACGAAPQQGLKRDPGLGPTVRRRCSRQGGAGLEMGAPHPHTSTHIGGLVHISLGVPLLSIPLARTSLALHTAFSRCRPCQPTHACIQREPTPNHCTSSSARWSGQRPAAPRHPSGSGAPSAATEEHTAALNPS